MAGAGYKLFNTGDVLTAAQVNTYLQEQTVMVFADATARTTALSGVLAEGMVTYLKDTNAIEKYTGAAWVNIDSGSTSPLTTKGDLYTYSTTDARLAVGNNGETLVADSSATTGLRWQGNFAAGKNKIINGDFGIWQRGTSFTVTTTNVYTADRYVVDAGSGATNVISRQTFTPGTAPVAGYEGQYFLRFNRSTTGSAASYFGQRIEDVRTFAGQTVTLSFWAKADKTLAFSAGDAFMYQDFGSGGSSPVSTNIPAFTVTTSWQRFSLTVAIPSIASKTVTTGTYLAPTFSFPTGLTTFSLDIWGFQLEAGNTATAFQTATGTLAGELAACQRYYIRNNQTAANQPLSNHGPGTSTTNADINITLPVSMRVSPTAVEFANLAVSDGVNARTNVTAVTLNAASTQFANCSFTVASGLTQYRSYALLNQTSTTAYLGFTAEL